MKQYRIFFVVFLLFFTAFIFRGTIDKNFFQKSSLPAQRPQAAVTVVIDDGVTQKKYANIAALTPYGGLLEAAKQNHLEVKTKQYDFGVFVESIGEVKNTKEKSWIYTVNDISGDVAADKKDLVMGDAVVWKYVTPTFEK